MAGDVKFFLSGSNVDENYVITDCWFLGTQLLGFAFVTDEEPMKKKWKDMRKYTIQAMLLICDENLSSD